MDAINLKCAALSQPPLPQSGPQAKTELTDIPPRRTYFFTSLFIKIHLEETDGWTFAY
jgi:hypothetical protein